jgi:hypothetical protein
MIMRLRPTSPTADNLLESSAQRAFKHLQITLRHYNRHQTKQPGTPKFKSRQQHEQYIYTTSQPWLPVNTCPQVARPTRSFRSDRYHPVAL